MLPQWFGKHWHKRQLMNPKLQKYVGNVVRLNKHAFKRIQIQAIRKGQTIENSFIVSEISRGVRKLICYGANLRIEVDSADAVLV